MGSAVGAGLTVAATHAARPPAGRQPMDGAIGGATRVPFPEQIAFYRAKLRNLVPTAAWDDMVGAAHDDAFMVAGAMEAQLLADLAGAVDRAIADGTGLDAFRRDFNAIVARHGWTGWTGEGTPAGRAWRTRVILRTNAATSYAAGRFAQLTEGKFAYWVYRHGASLEPRLNHLSWNGIALPPDHPFWTTHYPPSDWGCSCYVLGASSAAAVRRLGGDLTKKLPDGWNVRDAKSGTPAGIGRGWDYAPGASVARRTSALAAKIEQWPAMIGAGFGASLSARSRAALADAFGDFVDAALAGPPRGRHMVVGAMRPEWVVAATNAGVAPATAEIAVQDSDIWHIFRDSKKRKLEINWYRQLPLHLAHPSRALLDVRQDGHPTIILIFSHPSAPAKLALKINYRVHKQGKMNVIASGGPISEDDVTSMLRQPGISEIRWEGDSLGSDSN